METCYNESCIRRKEGNGMLSIMPARREELYEIASFLDACWKQAYAEILPNEFLEQMSVDRRYQMLLKAFDGGASGFLTARDGERLAGVSVYGKSNTEGYPDDGEVTALYLRAEYIGHGHGRALLARAEEGLVEAGYDHFVLDVLAGNQRAVRFYCSQGYQRAADAAVRLGGADYPLAIMRKARP